MLIQTKLHIAQQISTLVLRPRLSQRLAGWRAVRLLVVAAPAGFGKTTLVSAWAQDAFGRQPGSPTSLSGQSAQDDFLGWVSLDRYDNDPATFATYLAAALAPVIPEAAAAVQDLLAAATPAPDQVVAILANALLQVPQQVLLVLDDYHLIEAPAVHELLDLLLEHTPDNFHCLLLTRRTPPLALDRYRGRGQLRELRARELLFTVEEMREFFVAALPAALTEQALSQLTVRTGGWGAGMQVAAMVWREGAETGALPDRQLTARQLTHYVMAEVLDLQPEPLRRFMLQTAVLDELTPALCHAVTQEAASAALLDQLVDSVGLVTPLDSEQGIYRYHDLLSEVLRRQLQSRVRRDEVAALHCRAAAWYAGVDAVDQALDHYRQAGAHAAAADLVEERCRPALLRGDIQSAGRWLAQLPAHLLQEYPRLALDAAWLSIIDERTDAGARLAQAQQAVAAALPAATADHAWQQELLGLAAGAAFVRMDRAAAAELSQRGLATIAPDQDLARGICAFVQLILHRYEGPAEVVFQHAETANAAFARAGFIVGQISVQRNRAVCLYESGQGGQAAAGFQALLDFIGAASAGHLSEAADVHIQFGMLLYELNRIQEARRQFEAAQAIGRLVDNPRWTLSAGLWLKLCDQAEQPGLAVAPGDAEQEALLWRQVAAGSSPLLLQNAMTVRIHRWLGASDRVRAWEAAAAGQFDMSQAPALHQMRLFTAYVHAYLARGKSPAALVSTFSTWQDYLDAHSWSAPLKIEFQVAAASLSAALGNHARAVKALDEALNLVDATGYVRLVLDHLAPLQEVIRLSRHPALDQLRGEAVRNRTYAADPLLTPIELRVLRLAALDLTRKEIARQLSISESTVKFHLQRIYGKLGVSTRAAALAKAEEMEML